MQTFVPNDIVKSKLGTKFLIIKPKSFESTTRSLDIIYETFNMNLKQKSTLRVSSKYPDNFILLSRDELPEEEKNFNVEDTQNILLVGEKIDAKAQTRQTCSQAKQANM